MFRIILYLNHTVFPLQLLAIVAGSPASISCAAMPRHHSFLRGHIKKHPKVCAKHSSETAQAAGGPSLMQSSALLASSGLIPQSCSSQSSLSLTRCKVTRGAQLAPSCCVVRYASQSRGNDASAAEKEAQPGRDAIDTIRSLDSILGSTDDTDVKQNDEMPAASSLSAYSNNQGSVSLSSRPYSESAAAQDFRDELTPSRCVSAHSLVLFSASQLSMPARIRYISAKMVLSTMESRGRVPRAGGPLQLMGRKALVR